MVKLRLKRFGRTHRSVYRLGAMDERAPRDGRTLEELGIYDPANRNPAEQIKLNSERIQYWLSQGAIPTDTVRQLLAKSGITRK
jgi:small subunit ribosomal protein S16